MIRRWTALIALTGALTAGVAVGAGVPAFAADTPTRVCSNEAAGFVYRLYAYAVYNNNSATGLRQWTSFHFMVTGGKPSQSSNNVNIKLSESGETKFTYNSPDSLRFNTWYSTRPSTPVLTSMWGPLGEHDHRANDFLRFEGIFDISGVPDEKCTTLDLV